MTVPAFEHLIGLPTPTFDAVLGVLPEGWLWEWTGRLLYQLAKQCDGPVLEIGSLVGRSTACLALGIRDGGSLRPFVTTDLHFPTIEAFLTYYRPIHGPHIQVPELQAKYIQSGGTRPHLERNLDRLGLRHLVTVLTGDFREVAPIQRYSLVFCDASHDAPEIRRNMPGIRSLTGPGSIIVCDDIESDMHARLVNDSLNFSWWKLMQCVLIGVRE